MKKGTRLAGILVISLLLISIISVSFVSASWFSNFWGKITGAAGSGEATSLTQTQTCNLAFRGSCQMTFSLSGVTSASLQMKGAGDLGGAGEEILVYADGTYAGKVTNPGETCTLVGGFSTDVLSYFSDNSLVVKCSCSGCDRDFCGFYSQCSATLTYSACTPATEICDNKDNDCDGSIDEGDVCATCTDSDGGLDYYVKGAVKDATATKEDNCFGGIAGGIFLAEYYCSNNIAEQQNYECPNGCSNGACITEIDGCSDLSSAVKQKIGDIVGDGKRYTFELVSATDTTATIKVTDMAGGVSESKEISEWSSKNISGLTIEVWRADETNLKLSAEISVFEGESNLYLDSDNPSQIVDIGNLNIIVLKEGDKIHRSQYLIVPSDDGGKVLKVTSIVNQTTGYSQDRVKFTNAISLENYDASITAKGVGTVNFGGVVYNLKYSGASDVSEDERYITLDYPQTESNEVMTYDCNWPRGGGGGGANCTDSDGGLNYYVKGYIISPDNLPNPSSPVYDYCSNNTNTLWEGFCENATTSIAQSYPCPNGCEDGACVNATQPAQACQELIENPIVFNNLNDYNLVHNSSEHVNWLEFGNATIHEINYRKINSDDGLFVGIVVLDDINAKIADTGWVREVKQKTMWGGQREWVDNNGYWYYIIARDYDAWYYRYHFWYNDNVLVLITEDLSNGGQKDDSIEDFINKLKNNVFEVLSDTAPSTEMNIFTTNYMQKCNSDVSEECWPYWQHKIEPVICPEYGRQKDIWVDANGCNPSQEMDISCSPGICSGCYVPKWLGGTDNKCIPYGFRIIQESSTIERMYEEAIIEELITENGFDATFEIIKEGTALVEINSDIDLSNISNGEIKSFLFVIDGNEYRGMAGESLVIGLGYHSIDATYYDFNGNKVESQSAEIEISNIYYSTNPSKRYIEIMHRYDYPAYCDIDGWVKQQKIKDFTTGNWAKCQNNYECESNICSSGECIELKAIVEEANVIKAFFIKMFCRLFNPISDDEYNQCVYKYLGEAAA